MTDMNAQIEYVMRCKLPSSGGFHSGPSGDAEYEEAYRKVIFSNKPDGFEVAWNTQRTWPKDQDGMTWVKLYCTDEKHAVAALIDRLHSKSKQLDRAKDLARQISG